MIKDGVTALVLTCEQALRGALAARLLKEGDLATMLNLNSTSNSLVAPH